MEPKFRAAVLRYATAGAHRDAASTALWPEVVYPLIERARWHRRVRSRTETAWDYLCARILHVPDAGVVLDRAMVRSVPAPLVAQLDDSLDLLVESPRLDDEEDDPFAPRDEADRLAASISVSGSQINLAEIAADQDDDDRDVVRLVDPNPLRFTPGGAARALEGGALGAQCTDAGPARGQAAHPSPRPRRPLPPDRHPLDPRPRRRPDRDPGHGPEADRAHHPHRPHQGLRRQAPRGHLGLPRQQPGHRPPRLHELRALSSSGTPPRATSSTSTTPPTSTTSSSRSAWRSPTSSTRSCLAGSSPGTPSRPCLSTRGARELLPRIPGYPTARSSQPQWWHCRSRKVGCSLGFSANCQCGSLGCLSGTDRCHDSANFGRDLDAQTGNVQPLPGHVDRGLRWWK